MKRVVCLILLVLTLTSCSGQEKVESKLTDISFTAEISYYNEKYSADCTIDKENVLRAVIKIPETLEGFALTVSEKGITAEYLGIKYNPTDSNMPFAGVLEQTYDRLLEVTKSGTVKREDNTYKITVGEGADKAVLSITEGGLPILLEIPDERFFVEFYNVTILN